VRATGTAFYQALGFSQNPEYSDDTASCMVVDDGIYVMLLTEAKFRSSSPGRSATRRRPRCSVA
jgi:uncharacterized protein